MRDQTEEYYLSRVDLEGSSEGRYDEHHDCLIHQCDHFRCKLCLICSQCEIEKMEEAADAA